MRKEYELTKEEFAEIVKINKKGGDPVIYITGGQPIGFTLQEKINMYWDTLAKKYGFDKDTVQGITNTKFSAEETE
jgi:hypothetical protein